MENIIYKLKAPYTSPFTKLQITEVTISPPTNGDLKRARKSGGSEFDQNTKLVQICTGLNDEEWDAMSLLDSIAIGEVTTENFISPTLKA